MTLEPTPQLRFVERDMPLFVGSHVAKVSHVRVLQQWWRDVHTGEGVWRDVPLEAE